MSDGGLTQEQIAEAVAESIAPLVEWTERNEITVTSGGSYDVITDRLDRLEVGVMAQVICTALLLGVVLSLGVSRVVSKMWHG